MHDSAVVVSHGTLPPARRIRFPWYVWIFALLFQLRISLRIALAVAVAVFAIFRSSTYHKYSMNGE